MLKGGAQDPSSFIPLQTETKSFLDSGLFYRGKYWKGVVKESVVKQVATRNENSG